MARQCRLTAGSYTKCSNLHCGLWEIFYRCMSKNNPFCAVSQCYVGTNEIGTDLDFDKNFKMFVHKYPIINFIAFYCMILVLSNVG